MLSLLRASVSELAAGGHVAALHGHRLVRGDVVLGTGGTATLNLWEEFYMLGLVVQQKMVRN